MDVRRVSSSALRYEMSDHVILKALRIFSMKKKHCHGYLARGDTCWAALRSVNYKPAGSGELCVCTLAYQDLKNEQL
jgi:hypothetical protein